MVFYCNMFIFINYFKSRQRELIFFFIFERQETFMLNIYYLNTKFLFLVPFWCEFELIVVRAFLNIWTNFLNILHCMRYTWRAEKGVNPKFYFYLSSFYLCKNVHIYELFISKQTELYFSMIKGTKFRNFACFKGVHHFYFSLDFDRAYLSLNWLWLEYSGSVCEQISYIFWSL